MVIERRRRKEDTPPPPTPVRRVRGLRKGPLVRVTYIPDAQAYLIAEGPEQSEIQWVHNGNCIIVCNEHIERIEEP